MVKYVRMAEGLLVFSLLAVLFVVLVVPAVIVAIFGTVMKGVGEMITKGVACLLDASITALEYANKLIENDGEDCR